MAGDQLEVWVGDDPLIHFHFTDTDVDGVVSDVDLANTTLAFRLKNVLSDPDGTPIGTWTVTDQVGGRADLQLLSADATAASGRKWYSVKATKGGLTATAQAGSFLVKNFSTAELITTDDIAVALQRPLSVDEVVRAEQLIEEITETLAIYLGRDVVPTTRVDRVRVRQTDGALFLPGYPVIEVLSIAIDDGTPTTAWNTTWQDSEFPGTWATVTYLAGDDPPNPAVRGVAIQAVSTAIGAPAIVSAGAVSNYSVEGTSITFGSAVAGGNQGGAGRITAASLAGLSGLKKLPTVI